MENATLEDLIKIMKIKLPRAILPRNALQIFIEIALQRLPKNSNHDWLRLWLAPGRHQAMTLANVNPSRHVALSGHNELIKRRFTSHVDRENANANAQCQPWMSKLYLSQQLYIFKCIEIIFLKVNITNYDVQLAHGPACLCAWMYGN